MARTSDSNRGCEMTTCRRHQAAQSRADGSSWHKTLIRPFVTVESESEGYELDCRMFVSEEIDFAKNETADMQNLSEILSLIKNDKKLMLF